MPEPGAKWRRMDPRSLRAFVVEFTDHLAALGHTDLTVRGYEDAARHFAEWLERSDIALVDVDDKVVARFAGHRCKCTGNRRHHHVSAKYVRRVRRFVCFLARAGLVKMNIPSATKVVNVRVAEFQDFLRQHRGISERTIDRHGRMVMRLLPDLGDNPGDLKRRAHQANDHNRSWKKLSSLCQDDDDSAPMLFAILGGQRCVPPRARSGRASCATMAVVGVASISRCRRC